MIHDAIGIERQLTHASCGHILTNINVWSKDSEWIVFDVRSDPAGSHFDGGSIQRVWMDGRTEVLYQSRQGACCGVATVCPVTDRIAFILGPENPTNDWMYAAWNRRGLIVDSSYANTERPLDALDFQDPFTPGALRGGSHVHVFSPNGRFVSFTYEDRILQLASDKGADRNQRNIGVTWLEQSIEVPKTHPRNQDGSGFSVLVTKTTNSPMPGSDEIQKAYEDAWIGKQGYLQPDGTNQAGSLAFFGDCIDEKGDVITELFRVDFPDPPWKAPDDCTLQGTLLQRPCPPLGTSQVRLTRTPHRKYPGIQGPRHWPRSHPDGSNIAVLMKDDAGHAQIHLVDTLTGNVQALTQLPFPVSSCFTWNASGTQIAFAADRSIFTVDTSNGTCARRTKPSDPPPRPEAVVFSPDNNSIAYVRPVLTNGAWWNQIFAVEISG